MIISDLSFVEPLFGTDLLATDLPIPEQSAAEILGGAEGTGVSVGSQVFAFGEFTSTVTSGKAWAISSPYGSIALGYTLGGGLSYTPPEESYTLSDLQVWIAQYETR
jgi:hypothetical protein